MSSPEESARQSPRRKKKKKRLVKKQKPIDIISRTPGVHKMVLSELAQNIIGCIAGENITAENPWMYVKKELVQDNIELHEESSEFLPIKKFILEFPRSQLLIGYIPDETRDVDEFFICVTEEATDIVTEIIEKMKQDQEERLHNAITKEVHRWVSQGTEEQINESMIRNNRPLLEVEVETKYPIFPGKIQFRLVKAEDRKDGYMELVCERDKQPQNVVRTRIDGWAQVAPAFVSREAQTTCTYPINSSTQYLYEVEDCADWYTKNEQGIVTYTNDHMEDFSDLLKVNGAINLYANDFASLVHDVSTTVVRTVAAEFEEYMSLMDVFMCKDKMVSDICWHRMWSGTVAVCYADNAQNTFLSGPNKEDEVLRSVHGMNPMLLWSFMDGLKPKLILESPREVQVVSFCKFDENVLVGGCKNGQIVIWDLRNKLEKVEEVEILTSNQQKYRSYMFSLMGWMKNIFNLSIVRATAVSNLKYSHKGPVTDITWLDPHYEISKIGNLTEFPEHSDELSMQLMTSSEDGTLLVWDLLKKPTVTTGGVRIKKLKRLKRKPSALETQISPFKILNHNIKPLYKINVLKPNSKKHLPVSKFCSNYCHILYDAPITDKNKKFNLADRIMRQPRLDVRNKKGILPELFIGTMEGDFAKLKWDGQDFDSGEVVNSEVGQYIYFAKYHDAPIVTTVTAITHKCTLTVGGKVFALWRDDFPGRPVLWRRCKHLFTKAEWSIFQPYKFIVYSLDGVIQKWLLPVNSKEPISSHFMSSSYVTTCGMHPFKQQKNVYGIGDKQGVFRLFYSPPQATESNSTLSSMMDHFINREIKRKKNFLIWQEQWQKRHEVYIKEKRLESEAQIAEDKRREEAEAEKEDDKKDAAVRKGPQPGKYIEWVIEQRQKAEEARVRSIIINKKQLDTKELERRRKPLQKLEEENERKKKKQKQRLKEGENIFHETVATLFPDVVKEKPIPPPDPYSGGDAVDELNHCFREFEHLKYDSEEYIEDNPYLFEFDWKKTLMGGRKARQFLDDVCFVNLHWKRYDQEKQERKRMMGIVDEEELRTEDLEGVSERQSEMDDVDDENNAERSQSKSRHRSTVQFED